MTANGYATYRTVSVDFDVHKALTARLQNATDTDNDVLRRLFDLPTEPCPKPRASESSGQSWIAKGVIFPHNTEFRLKYKGKLYLARVEDGALVYDGQRYDSPSPAAIAIGGHSMNGWLWWECRLPGSGSWVQITGLR